MHPEAILYNIKRSKQKMKLYNEQEGRPIIGKELKEVNENAFVD